MRKHWCFWVLLCFLVGTLPGKGVNYEIATDTFPEKVTIAKLRNKTKRLEKTIVPLSTPELGAVRGNIVDPVATGNNWQNVFEMIRGRVAGVWVAGGFNSYRIRIRAAMEPPLVVIDGMPFYNRTDEQVNSLLMNIPPADVDYIEVLKNIGETVSYGPGAGNGVIVVHMQKAAL